MRIFSIILALLLILLPQGTVAQADTTIPDGYLTDAELCYELGLIIGSGNGVTADYLESSALRIQSAVILLRLVGLEDDMLSYNALDGDNFEDVSDNGYEQKVLGYLYNHKELGWSGNGNGEFNANKPLTARELTKVLLESLGYKQGVDFTWDTVFEFSQKIGFGKYTQYDNPELDIAAVCEMISEALVQLMKDQTLLVQHLIDLKVVDKDLAVEYELIRADLAIEYVDVISDYALKVYLNVPIDYVDPQNIKIPGLFVQEFKLDPNGRILRIKIAGYTEGQLYEIQLKGSKYANIIQNDTSYVFAY